MNDDSVNVNICMSQDYIEYMREKFDIENEDDLISAIWECISTYMEL